MVVPRLKSWTTSFYRVDVHAWALGVAPTHRGRGYRTRILTAVSTTTEAYYLSLADDLDTIEIDQTPVALAAGVMDASRKTKEIRPAMFDTFRMDI